MPDGGDHAVVVGGEPHVRLRLLGVGWDLPGPDVDREGVFGHRSDAGNPAHSNDDDPARVQRAAVVRRHVEGVRARERLCRLHPVAQGIGSDADSSDRRRASAPRDQVGLVDRVVACAEEARAREVERVVGDDDLVVADAQLREVLEERLGRRVAEAEPTEGPRRVTCGGDGQDHGRLRLRGLKVRREPAIAGGIVEDPGVALVGGHVQLKEAPQGECRDGRTGLVADASEGVDHLEHVVRPDRQVRVGRTRGEARPRDVVREVRQSLERRNDGESRCRHGRRPGIHGHLPGAGDRLRRLRQILETLKGVEIRRGLTVNA